MTSTQARHRALLAAFLGWMFDGMEMGIFPLVARPALRAMGAAHGAPEGYVQTWMGIVTAFFLLGAAVGGVLFGWLGDRVGRVKAMTWSILAYSLFTGLCYFAAEPWHLAVLRFVAALGMGGEWALGVALVMETWPEGKRPWLAGAIGAAANIGYVIIAVIGMRWPIREDSWRWVMMIGAAPAALTFFIRLFVPESEKWAASVQRAPDRSPVREVFRPPLLGRTLLAIVFASIPLMVTWGIVQWIPLWAEKLTGGADPLVKARAQLASAGGAVIGSLLAPVLGGAIGRRPAYALLCAASLAAGTWLFRGLHAVDGVFLLATFLVGACTASFYGWLPLYLPELFPTRARATGQGLAFNFGRVFAAVGAWQMPALMAFFGGSYSQAGATLVLVYLAGAALIWLAPETKDRPLPD